MLLQGTQLRRSYQQRPRGRAPAEQGDGASYFFLHCERAVLTDLSETIAHDLAWDVRATSTHGPLRSPLSPHLTRPNSYSKFPPMSCHPSMCISSCRTPGFCGSSSSSVSSSVSHSAASLDVEPDNSGGKRLACRYSIPARDARRTAITRYCRLSRSSACNVVRTSRIQFMVLRYSIRAMISGGRRAGKRARIRRSSLAVGLAGWVGLDAAISPVVSIVLQSFDAGREIKAGPIEQYNRGS